MTKGNLIILTKIIFFYSLFYTGLRLVLLFKGAWLLPNLMLALSFALLAVISGVAIKRKGYSWILAVMGAIWIILTRIFESRWGLWIHEQFPFNF